MRASPSRSAAPRPSVVAAVDMVTLASVTGRETGDRRARGWRPRWTLPDALAPVHVHKTTRRASLSHLPRRPQPAHRARERALVAAGVDVTLVVPSSLDRAGRRGGLSREAFPIVELPVRRPGDVNRHAYADSRALARLCASSLPTCSTCTRSRSASPHGSGSPLRLPTSRSSCTRPRTSTNASRRRSPSTSAPRTAASPPCTRAAARPPPSRAARASRV